jgi:hypothetical protein
MASTTFRVTSSAASSWQLHRDRGTPVAAGNWQASALTSVSARGGKGSRSTWALPVCQAVHSFLEEPFAPHDDRIQSHPEALRHRGVLLAVGRPQHDPGTHNLAALRRLFTSDSFQASTVGATQLDHERAVARHHTSRGPAARDLPPPSYEITRV